MDPELFLSGSQARLPMEGLGHITSHKTSDLKFALPTRCARVKMEQKLREWLNNNWSSLRPMPSFPPVLWNEIQHTYPYDNMR